MLQLGLATFLLLFAPQLSGLAAGALSRRHGSWWPIVAGVILPPLAFYLLATHGYSSTSDSWLQRSASGSGRIEVTQVDLGVIAHGAVALLIQIGHVARGRRPR